MRSLLSIPSCFSLAVLFAATTSVSAVASTSETLSTNLRSFGVDVALDNVRIGSETGPIMKVPDYQIGQAVSYDGPTDLTFYLHPTVDREPDRLDASESSTSDSRARPAPPPATPGEEMILIGRVALNPQWKETLLVWIPVGDSNFSILALPNDLGSLPANHLRFINTTRQRIGLEIREGESRVLKPGEEYTLSSNKSEAVYFWSAMEANGSTAERISNVVEMRTHVRRTVFLTFSNSAATGNDPTEPPRFGFFVMTHD